MTPNPDYLRASAAGFTLIELTLVAFIFALFVSLASTFFRNSFDALNRKAALQQIQNVLQLAQTKAILERRDYGVHFTAANNAYWLIKSTDESGDNDFSRIQGQWGVLHHLPQTFAYGGDETSIVFYPDGTATPARLPFNAQPRRLELEINPVNGKARVYENS